MYNFVIMAYLLKIKFLKIKFVQNSNGHDQEMRFRIEESTFYKFIVKFPCHIYFNLKITARFYQNKQCRVILQKLNVRFIMATHSHYIIHLLEHNIILVLLMEVRKRMPSLRKWLIKE